MNTKQQNDQQNEKQEGVQSLTGLTMQDAFQQPTAANLLEISCEKADQLREALKKKSDGFTFDDGFMLAQHTMRCKRCMEIFQREQEAIKK